jgi:MFS family permease
MRAAALSAAVGLVLADGSIVVLALPQIYRELDVSVSAVVWVLISFNLVLAAVAVPAALASRAVGPARLTCAGLVLFSAASLGCGLADDIGLLIGARCVQALGGAAAVCGALELLPVSVGSERGAAARWAMAGAIGAALGPALGGLLTDLVSWQSIFLLQVPVALVLALLLLRAVGGEGSAATVRGEVRAGGVNVRASPPHQSPGSGLRARSNVRASPQHQSPGSGLRAHSNVRASPHVAANAALGLIAAALAAALFLLVLLLIEGWRLSPIAAAAAISVMPLAALLSSPLARQVPSVPARAAAGAILIAGGLAGLGLLPDATVALTFPSQVLVGVGLALTLTALTEAALAGRAPQAIHGGWTIAARHAGVVLGLLLLTPVFTADLREQRRDAIDAGTAVLLDARVEPLLKIDLAERVTSRLEEERGRVPVIGPAFEPLPDDPEDREAVLGLEADLQDQLDRAATHAFSASFLLAAGFALAALITIGLARRVEL